MDEAFDVSRSVRDARWLYLRNFMPHLSWMQPEGYSDASTFRQGPLSVPSTEHTLPFDSARRFLKVRVE